jgi:putative tryptophan/tyrosine transport system substrate-binding protein
MRRREFIAGLGSAAAAWPMAARAQQQGIRVIGFLHPASPGTTFAPYLAAFRQGLSEQGFVEGRNLAIEFRWAGDDFARLPALAADLVRRGVAVIVAGANAAYPAKAATASIPIVFSIGSDPVKFGLVASLNRPGGNATGTIQFSNELSAKRLQILREMVPKARLIGAFYVPGTAVSELRLASVMDAARRIGQEVRPLSVASLVDIDAAFATMDENQVGALLVPNSSLFTNNREHLISLAARYAIPATYEYREFVTAGGLFSYGSSLRDSYRLVGTYVGRILKGENPADLPVVQPTRFEFVINLNTANALGLTIPETLLATADEVIQ